MGECENRKAAVRGLLWFVLLAFWVLTGLVYPYQPDVRAEDDKAPEIVTRIDVYDGTEVVYSYSPGRNVGEDIVVPGLPDNVRKRDGIFSCFCTGADGTGQIIYPGDTFTLTEECTALYLIWEQAAALLPDAVSRTFIEKFTKTNTLPKSFAIQGGALAVREGRRYWIQAAVRDVTEDIKAAQGVEIAMNYTAIFIYDYETGEIVNSAFNIPFGHGNDLEYNANLDKIIICSALEEGEAITEVGWDLETYSCFTPDAVKGFRVTDCAYDSETREYLLTAAPADSNYLNDSLFLLTYDENWQLLDRMPSPFAVPENHYGFQGACIYEGYYYLVNFLKDNLQESGTVSFKYARISIYDRADMSYIGSFPVGASDEIEDITILGNTAYFNGQLYKKDGEYRFGMYELNLEALAPVLQREEPPPPAVPETTVETTAATTADEITGTTTVSGTSAETTATAATLPSVTEITSTAAVNENTSAATTVTETTKGEPATDAGTGSGDASLPQTGNASWHIVMAASAAFLLMLTGAFAIQRSGVPSVRWKMKESDAKCADGVDNNQKI